MTKKTVTEKRFFEWHEDDVSVTLRNKSGSYGGQKCLLSKSIGCDLYNHVVTWNVTMTLCSKSADPHHIPCVILEITKE